MRFGLILVVGLVFTVVPLIFFIPEALTDLQVFKTGQEVKAEISEMPTYCNGKRNFCRFKYNNFFFVKQVSNDFCNAYKRYDTIIFKYSPKYPEVFVFPGSSDYYYFEIVSSVLISLLGLLLIFNSKKISNRIQSKPLPD